MRPQHRRRVGENLLGPTGLGNYLLGTLPQGDGAWPEGPHLLPGGCVQVTRGLPVEAEERGAPGPCGSTPAHWSPGGG